MPPRASSADNPELQSAQQIAAAIEAFLAEHAHAAVLEDGKVAFDLRAAKFSLSTEHDRCTLHLWSEERNVVRRVVSATERAGTLRLDTRRFGQAQTKLLELVADRERRTPTTRDTERTRYVALLERVLAHAFSGWKPEGLHTAMDLEKSFGPAYTRGTLRRGNQVWAVIGANEQESAVVIDGILTLGILWLQACRERGDGRRIVVGLKVIVPSGTGTLTLARMAWLNPTAAQWELWELKQSSEDMLQRDLADQGNLHTRLVHHPDEQAAEERFAPAIAQLMELVPRTERHRVERRLRSSAEMVFLCHGLGFARAQMVFAPNSFAQRLDVSVGTGPAETLLTPDNHAELAERVAELFARRRAVDGSRLFARQGGALRRRIGAPMTAPAHARIRAQSITGSNDPLFRAAPERWLESMLRHDLAPLTRNLAPYAQTTEARSEAFANEADPDTIGNRVDADDHGHGRSYDHGHEGPGAGNDISCVIPRLDPSHVYAQVPAIAGASDRGLLDLLGVTADGRLAVIELKADDDLHLALQGLDYWIRVRHHHLQTPDPATGLGEFQRHGYFHGVELSPLPPRLYLVAPALHIHPATETVLRYLSPRVEWQLLALDERWRSQIRVVWRKQGGAA